MINNQTNTCHLAKPKLFRRVWVDENGIETDNYSNVCGCYQPMVYAVAKNTILRLLWLMFKHSAKLNAVLVILGVLLVWLGDYKIIGGIIAISGGLAPIGNVLYCKFFNYTNHKEMFRSARIINKRNKRQQEQRMKHLRKHHPDFKKDD
jgi:hypothetical protein